MSDDLAARVKTHERNLNNGFPMTCEIGRDLQKAAARIAALTAERDAMAEACAKWAEVSQGNYQRAKAAEARVAELEGALRDMVPPELKWREQGTTCLITHPTEVIRAARAALNKKGHTDDK